MKKIIIFLIIINLKLFGNDSILVAHQNSSIFKIEREVLKKPLKKYQNISKHPSDYIQFAESELLKNSELKFDLCESKTNSQLVSIYSLQLVDRLVELAIKGDSRTKQAGILIKSENLLQFGRNIDYLKTVLNDSTMLIAQQITNAIYVIKYFDQAIQLLSDSLSCQDLNTNEKEKTLRLIKKIITEKVNTYDVISEKFKNAPVPLSLTNEERDTYKELLNKKRCEFLNEELNTIDICTNICSNVIVIKENDIINMKIGIGKKYHEECTEINK